MRKITLLMLLLLCSVTTMWAQTTLDVSASSEKNWATDSWTSLENIPQEMLDANLQAGMTSDHVKGLEEEFSVKSGYLWTQFQYSTGSNRLDIIGVDVLDNNNNIIDSDYHFGYTGTYQLNRDYVVYIPEDGTYKIRYWVTFKNEGNTSTGKITTKHVKGKIAHKKYFRISTDAFQNLYMHINNYNVNSYGSTGSVILKAEEENADQLFTFISTGKDDEYYVKSLSDYFLKVTYWNYDANNSSKTAFLFEENDTKEGYLITQKDYTNGGDKTKAQTIDGVTYLFNNDAEGQIWKLTEVNLETLSPVTVNYSFTYNGVEKYTQSVETKVAMQYPDITVEHPFGIVASKPVGNIRPNEVVDGVVNKIVELHQNLPFVAYDNIDNITRWYYMKMHTNNRKYIQYLSNQDYLEWSDNNMENIEAINSYSWAFVGNVFDGFTLINKAAGLDKAVFSAGSGHPNMVDISKATKFEYSRTETNVQNGFCLKHSNMYLNAQSGKVAHWGSADAGSTFVLIDALPINLTTDDTNPIYYAIRSGRGDTYWYTYFTDGDKGDKIKLASYEENNDKQLWYFKGEINGDNILLRLFPKTGEGKVMSYENTENAPDKIIAKELGTEGWTNTWKFVFTNSEAPFRLQTSDGKNYLSNNGGTGNNMGMWNGNPDTDTGTAMYIYETMLCEVTDEASNIYTSTYFGKVNTKPLFTGVEDYTLSNCKWNGNSFTANIAFPYPVSKVDGITNATMIRQSSFDNTDKRWRAVEDGGENYVKVQQAKATPTNIKEWLWAIYPQLDNNTFTFKVKNIATGKYAYANPASGNDATGTNKPVSLNDSGTAFAISKNGDYVKFNYTNTEETSLHTTINGSADTDVFLGVYSGSHNGDNISFIAPEVDVTVGNAGYSTLFLDFPVAVPTIEGEENVAYIAKDNVISDGYVHLTPITGVIPANTGVIIKAPEGNYTFSYSKEALANVEGNLLNGSLVDETITKDANKEYYVLWQDAEGVGMRIAGNGGDNTTFINRANKAYLVLDKPVIGASLSAFYGFRPGTTAIEEVVVENNENVIYDLQGRRVSEITKAGIYIINGHKVFVK